MEGPVLTTPSSQRLRSAVGACAQPPHSYFGSSTYLGARIQCEAHNSGGGCIKKFHCFGKNGDSSVFDKLNLTKKGGPGTSNEIPKNGCRRPKLGTKTCLTRYCGFGSTPSRFQAQVGPRKHRRNGRDGDSLSEVEPYDSCPAEFLIKNEFLSNLTVNCSSGVDSRTLPGHLRGDVLASDSARRQCDRNLGGGGCPSGSESTLCSGLSNKTIGQNGSAKILNYCTKNRKKIKRKNIKKSGLNENGGVLLFGKNAKEKISDECYNCGAREDESVDEVKNEKQEISKWQPKHAVTRRTAQIVRKIRNAWEKRVGASRLVAAENVPLLFNDLQLFVSASQVAEMLKCAQECSKNPSSKHLTFGEFYKIASDLMRTDCRVTSASPSPRVLEENVEKRRRKLSRSMSKYEVFLGGSCNPTTWRTDLAIPELENMNITYYNPQQVEEWRPELLEVEYQAKENATVMFFVIDNQTRGISALIEVAHLAGNDRKLILVIQSFTQKKQIISNEEISQKEYEDLKVGQEVLQDLVERQRIPVFDDIKVALKSTEKILREGITPQDLEEGNRITRKEDAVRLQDIFDELDQEKTGKIYFREACLALKLLYRQKVSFKRLEALIGSIGNNLNGNKLASDKIDFASFTKLVDQYEKDEQLSQQQQQQQHHHEENASTCFVRSNFPTSPADSMFDVYLGGTLENTNWRQSIAIPVMTSENLRYFAPKMKEGKREFTDLEAVAMENSFALLFVITDTARSIAAMAIAGHYIGRGANVVLCVQHLPEGAQIGSEMLTDRAVKDYNRGRMYLMDIAKRMGVAVFEDISDAVRFVVDRCKSASAAETTSISSISGEKD